MKGDADVIKKLNEILTNELTSVDIYFVQSQMVKNMGYSKIHEHLKHEMEHEQSHASKVIERIVFLEGDADVQTRVPFKVETDIVKMFEMDLAYEMKVKDVLVDAIELCMKKKDFVTMEVLEPLLVDTEEDHIDWLETQLSIIKDIGIKNYLAEKI